LTLTPVDAAVGGHRFDNRTARTEIHRKLFPELTLNGPRVINADAAVHGSGLEVRGVVLGIDNTTPPLVVLTSSVSPSQRSPVSSTTKPPFVVEPRTAPPVFQHHTTVQRREIDRPLTSAIAIPPLCVSMREIRAAWDEHFIAHVPVIILRLLRTTGKNLRAA
jgi:hypothetical protein